MMKKLFFVILFLVSNDIFGQDYLWSINVNLNGGRTALSYFDEYADEYNLAFEEILSKELGDMRWSYGYSLGTSAVINDAYFELDYENKFTSTKAVFIEESDGVRHFNAKHNLRSFVVGYADGDDEIWFNTGVILGINKIYLNSYRDYPSGTVPTEFENFTDGNYEGQNFSIGLKSDWNFAINERIFFNAGFKLTFSNEGKYIREQDEEKKGFYFYKGFEERGMHSMTRSGTIHIGLKFALVNDL